MADTVSLQAQYPYIFARCRERGNTGNRYSIIEAEQAWQDNAPGDVLERHDFNPARGAEAEERLKAAIESANGGAFCVYKKPRGGAEPVLVRVWYRIGAVKGVRHEKLQSWAETYRRLAVSAQEWPAEHRRAG